MDNDGGHGFIRVRTNQGGRANSCATLFIAVLLVTGCSPVEVSDAPPSISPEPTALDAARPEGAIDWSEARAHLGESATVCGPVVSTFTDADGLGQPTFLNLGVDHPDPSGMTVIIFGDYRVNFPSDPATSYFGVDICVTGDIRAHEEFVQIEARSPDQIAVRAPRS